MIKAFVISVIVIFIASIVGISFYLQINDLAGCGEKPSDTNKCKTADAIMTVSGGDTNARAEGAIRLYKNGWGNIIIFSGAAQDKLGPSNASVMKDLAVTAGVPASDIYLDEYSETTEQNAKNTLKIFVRNNIKSVILVTSAYHQRRASLEFNKHAKNVVITNYSIQSDKYWSFMWWLTPYGWWLAISEIVKIIIFYITGIWS